MLKKLLVLVALLATFPAFAQNVQYISPVTRGHVPVWNTNGVIADGGSSADSPITSIGVTNEGGAGFCVSSQRQTAAGRNQLCFGASTAGPATISLQNYGTAAPQGLNYVINGVIVSIPTGGGSFIFGNGPFAAGHVPCFVSSAAVIQDCGLALSSGVVIAGTWQGTVIDIPFGGTNATTASGARANLGLGTMATQSSNNVTITGGTITGMPIPVNASDVAVKSYVDASSSGLNILAPSRLATAAVLPNSPTYSNGASGVGATLTAGSNTTLTVDGSVANLNDVVLVKNQASAFQNGIYTVTTAGGGVAWVLTRATYFNTAALMKVGSYTFITAGSANLNASFTLQSTVVTVGTDALNFVQFSSGSTGTVTSAIIAAGTNISVSGTCAITISGTCTITTANGTSGYAFMGNGGSASTYQGFLQGGTGGVTQTWQDKAADFVSGRSYGAVDDNSTDNTPLIQAAINYAITNIRTLYLPRRNTGVYLLNTAFSASQVLNIPGPIRIVCEPGVWLKPSSSITNAQSILYFTGVTTNEIVVSKTIVDGCNIGDPTATTRFGNHGIVFDTTAACGATCPEFVQPVVENLKITYANINAHSCFTSTSGCAIYVNNIASNTSGGTFGAVFKDSMLAGGVYFGNAGDSNSVVRVFFPPDLTDANASNQGVYANLITGAGVLLLDTVNCQVLNGCLIVDNASSVDIKNSNFEQISTNGENNNAIIDIGSSVLVTTLGVGGVHIDGGSIVSSDCTNHPFLITFNKVGGGSFDNVRLGENCGSYPHAMVQLTANSSYIYIGIGNTWFANGSIVPFASPTVKYSNLGTNNYTATPATP
jgi:hypothetical protein